MSNSDEHGGRIATGKNLPFVSLRAMKKVITVGTINGPRKTSVPEEILATTEYKSGKQFSKLRLTASLRHGVLRGLHFQNVGRATKVDFDYSGAK